MDPFAPVVRLDDATLDALIATARRLMLANLDDAGRSTTARARSAGGQRLWVYGRAGRPCRRCGTRIAVARHGEVPRATWWCPGCQTIGRAAATDPLDARHRMTR